MAGFLTDSDIATILAAVKGTTDTFMRQPVTFQLRAAKLSRFSDDKDSRTSIREVEVLGLYVPGPEDIDMNVVGTVDLTTGYILVNREDLAAVGLADLDGNLLVNPATDTVFVAGQEHTLRAAIPLGPLDGRFTLGKFLTKKMLRSNTP